MYVYFAAAVRRQRAALLLAGTVWTGSLVGGAVLGGDLGLSLGEPESRAGWGLFVEVALNNMGVAALLFLSALTAGLAAIPVSVLTGGAAGIVLGEAWPSLSGSDLFLHVLPHTVVEIPGILLAAGAGTVPLVSLCRKAFGQPVSDWRTDTRDTVRLFALSLSLLVVAALVEAWLSTLAR